MSDRSESSSSEEGVGGAAVAVAANAEDMPPPKPTREEIELWKEISGLIDSSERVDATRAMVSLNNACRYCKTSQEQPHCKEARRFLDDNMSQVIAVLLYAIGFGDGSTLERDRIKSCLVSALDTVLNDLAAASVSGKVCETLPALLLIFDKVDGYQELTGLADMRAKFRTADGIRNLGLYLSSNAGRDFFPPLDSVTTILGLVTDSIHFITREDAFVVARTVMMHLSSLDEEQLVRLGDDSIDISHKAKQIYCHNHFDRLDSLSVFEYYKLFRGFVLRLLQSSDESLKLLGWAELENVVKESAERRPFPRVYIVAGAGIEQVNGMYELDPDMLTEDGHLKSRYGGVRYIKRASDNSDGNEEATLEKLYYYSSCWRIYRKVGRQADLLYENQSQNDFTLTPCPRPCETGWSTAARGVGPPPTVKPLGLVFEVGHYRKTLEHDVAKWILRNDLLELVAEDLNSAESHIRDGADAALRSMWNLLHQVSALVQEMIPALSELGNIRNDIVADDTTRALSFAHSFMLNLLNLTNSTLEKIGPSCITKLRIQVKLIHESAGIIVPRYIFDYHIFHRLLVAKMLVSTSSLRDVGVQEFRLVDDQDVLLEYNASLDLPMTRSQQNLLYATRSLLVASKQCCDELLSDENETATNIKQMLDDCMLHLDAGQLNGTLYIALARCTIRTLSQVFIQNSPECNQVYYSLCSVVLKGKDIANTSKSNLKRNLDMV